MTDDRTQARKEAAELLGVDVEHLSPADALRCDMIASLRLVIDAEQSAVLSGNQADLGKLNTAVTSLIALLPNRELPAQEANEPDPRQVMWEIYSGMRRRGEIADPVSTFEGRMRRITELEAKVAELEAALAAGGAPAPAAPTPAAPLPSNVVPLSPPPSSPPAAPVAAAPKAAPATPAYDYNRDDSWKAYVNSDGSIRSTPRGRWDV